MKQLKKQSPMMDGKSLRIRSVWITAHIAISRSVYDEFFVQDAIAQLVQRNQLKLIVVELAKKAIVQWIN